VGRQELQSLIDGVKAVAPKVIEDLIPNILPIGTVLKVVRNLLKEGVSVRDLRTILETLADSGVAQKDPTLLTEQVRAAISRSITRKLLGSDGSLQLITLDRTIEETIAGGIIHTDQGQQVSLDPDFVRRFVAELNARAMEMTAQSSQAVVLCSPLIRHHVKHLIDRFVPNVTVLSHNEISPSIPVKALGTVRFAYAS
jgi:flagellar biosynthesis protein FlhA